MKKQKVYVLNATDFKTSAYDIENWALYAEKHNKLLPEALEFIQKAEEQGTAYSIYGFQMAFNLEETIGMNDWVFITNCYNEN